MAKYKAGDVIPCPDGWPLNRLEILKVKDDQYWVRRIWRDGTAEEMYYLARWMDGHPELAAEHQDGDVDLWTALDANEDDTLWTSGADAEHPVALIRECDVPGVVWKLVLEALVARQDRPAQSQGVEAWGRYHIPNDQLLSVEFEEPEPNPDDFVKNISVRRVRVVPVDESATPEDTVTVDRDLLDELAYCAELVRDTCKLVGDFKGKAHYDSVAGKARRAGLLKGAGE